MGSNRKECAALLNPIINLGTQTEMPCSDAPSKKGTFWHNCWECYQQRAFISRPFQVLSHLQCSAALPKNIPLLVWECRALVNLDQLRANLKGHSATRVFCVVTRDYYRTSLQFTFSFRLPLLLSSCFYHANPTCPPNTYAACQALPQNVY